MDALHKKRRGNPVAPHFPSFNSYQNKIKAYSKQWIHDFPTFEIGSYFQSFLIKLSSK